MSTKKICDGCGAEIPTAQGLDGQVEIEGSIALKFDACNKSCVRRVLIALFCDSYQTGKTESAL